MELGEPGVGGTGGRAILADVWREDGGEVIYGESLGGPNSDNGEIAPGECVSSDETLVILLAAIESPRDEPLVE